MQLRGLDGVVHSKCVQKKIGDPTDAGSVFNSADGHEIVVVAVPTHAGDLCCGCCCFLPYVRIPSGYFSLWQRWYKHQGRIEPGVKFCYPFYNRVSHIINAATITYSAPSRQVPTADNVMVDINLSLTFAIGPGSRAAPPRPIPSRPALPRAPTLSRARIHDILAIPRPSPTRPALTLRCLLLLIFLLLLSSLRACRPRRGDRLRVQAGHLALRRVSHERG